MTIGGATRLLGVMGDPVEHSLSPLMHNAAIARLGVDYVYLPLPVKPQDLAAAVAGLRAIGMVGFNLTIPHKQAILPLLHHVMPEAQWVGAVNTVWWDGTGWAGTNTDVQGFMAPLLDLDRPWSDLVPVVLGNGGAARAVVVGCYKLGCKRIQVVGRDRQRLEEFRASWQDPDLVQMLETHTWEQIPHLLPRADLLVNTTPIGMAPQGDRSPLTMETMALLPAGAIAYDLIYTPRPTLFLRQAQDQGLMAIDGLEMLIQQGAAALEIWLQQSVPVEAMRQALYRKLNHN